MSGGCGMLERRCRGGQAGPAPLHQWCCCQLQGRHCSTLIGWPRRRIRRQGRLDRACLLELVQRLGQGEGICMCEAAPVCLTWLVRWAASCWG